MGARSHPGVTGPVIGDADTLPLSLGAPGHEGSTVIVSLDVNVGLDVCGCCARRPGTAPLGPR